MCPLALLQSVIYTQLLHPVSWRSLFSNLTVRSDARCSRSLRFRSCNARGASNIPSQRATIVRPIRQAGNPLFQGTGIYGLPWTATVYGGSIISDRYFAAAVGLGKSLGDIGSVSLDGTFSRTQFADENDTGGAFRFQYSKDIATSGTTFTVLGYRYSTSGYHDFSEANGDGYSNWSTGHQDKEERRAYEAWRGKYTKRSRTQANINQSLGDYGSLYLSVYEQQYWGGDRDRNVNAGFNTSHNDINYSRATAMRRPPISAVATRPSHCQCRFR
jgi:outer membrane usher protein